MRKAYKDTFLKKHNIKLGFMSAFVKASAYALMDQPSVNGGMLSFTQSHIYLNKAQKTIRFASFIDNLQNHSVPIYSTKASLAYLN